MSRKWMLRLGLTALAFLVTTDRRRPKPKPAPAPPDDTPKKAPLQS